MSNKDYELTLIIHERGINYVRNLLERSGFVIQAVNKDLTSPSQLLARAAHRSLLIAVRTACHPEAGRLDKENREILIKEAERLNAVPYFTGILLTSMHDGDIQAEDIAGGIDHKVIFKGMSAIR